MPIEWFVFFRNSILGPFSTEDVKVQLSEGKISNDSFVWWKGEKDWMPIESWDKNYNQIIRRLEAHFKVNWKIRIHKNTTPYMSFEDCLAYLKQVELNNSIYICKEQPSGAEDWESIFSNSIVLNALEMSRRKHPRVPILATAKISKLDSKFSYLVKVSTVGIGGLGVSGLGKNFPTGTTISLKIESAGLATPVVCEGKILYHTKDGLSGVEFLVMNDESQASLISYINQFSSQAKIRSAAA